MGIRTIGGTSTGRTGPGARTKAEHGRALWSGVAGVLGQGPGRLGSPAMRWAVSVLAVAGAALLLVSAIIHIRLWAEGYRDIAVIGPLFLAQGVAGIVLAVMLGLFRRVWLLLAGAALLAGTGAGLLLSAEVSLFGYRESLAVPQATSSLVVEFTGAAVLVAAAAVLLAARPGQRKAASWRV